MAETAASVPERRRGSRPRGPRRSPERGTPHTIHPSPSQGLSSNAIRAAILALITFFVYLPAMRSGFIWDDDSFLYENKLIHASDGLKRFWFSTEAPDYFPLTSSTLWIEWRLFGMNAAGYHVVNVLLHIGSSLLLWRILERLRIPAAWVGGLLFALHPVNVESVAWITERKNTLSLFLYAVSLLAYLRFDQEGRKRDYAGALAAFTLALLAKTAVVMLPVVLLGCAWWQRRRIARRDLVRSLPFFAVAGVLALVTIWFQQNRAIATDVVREDSFAARLAGAGWAVWFYLGKALFPVNLSFVYPRWTIQPQSVAAWIPLLALVGSLALFWAKRGGWGRAPLAGLGYFTLVLFPVLGFFDIYFMNYSLVADHWQYVALPAAVAFVAGGTAWLAERRRLPGGVPQALAATAAFALLILTVRQQRIYASPEELWQDTLQKNPSARLAHNNLATHYEHAGDLPRALSHAEAAFRLKPEDPVVSYNLGNILEKMGQPEEAVARFREAIRLKPGFAEAHNNLGNVLAAQGRPAEALAAIREALRIDPQLAEGHYSLGNLAGTAGNAAQAIEHYREALRLRPHYAEAHNNIASQLLKVGQLDEAAAHWNRALELNPEDLFAHYNLGILYEKQGKRDEALAQFRRAAQLNPDWEPAQKKLQASGIKNN